MTGQVEIVSPVTLEKKRHVSRYTSSYYVTSPSEEKDKEEHYFNE